VGGLGSHEFMAPSAAGEDEIALCPGCGYAANVELARGVPAAPVFPAWTREEVATPNARTIAEVSAFLKVDPRLTIKSLVYMTASGPVLALVRGDHAIHDRKLVRALGDEIPPAHADEVRSALGASVGSVGPVGARVPVLADEALTSGSYVVGANRDGFHVRGVVPGRDFDARFVDLHTVQAGEACPPCGKPPPPGRGDEVGNNFKLGTKKSLPPRAPDLHPGGPPKPRLQGRPRDAPA